MEPIQNEIAGPTGQLSQGKTPRQGRERRSLRRRALLAAAGVAGFTALTRLARAGDLKPPPGPITPTGTSLSEMQQKLGSSIDTGFTALDTKVAFTPKGISEPRTPLTSLPSSTEAQFVVTQPGAYYLSSNVVQVPGKITVDIQADHVDIDGQGFVFLGDGGGGSGGSICVRASARQAIEIYDCAFKGWQGPCCDLDGCDDVHISDVLFQGCVSSSDPAGTQGSVVRCGDRACLEDVVFSSCVGRAVECRAMCLFSDAQVLDHHGEAVRCADGACIEESRFLRIEGEAITMGSSCTVTECEFRQCNGLAISGVSGCVIECCECVGGKGGGFRCLDGSCVEDCTVLNRDALAIECGSRSSVTGNQVLLCWGISCGAESVRAWCSTC